MPAATGIPESLTYEDLRAWTGAESVDKAKSAFKRFYRKLADEHGVAKTAPNNWKDAVPLRPERNQACLKLYLSQAHLEKSLSERAREVLRALQSLGPEFQAGGTAPTASASQSRESGVVAPDLLHFAEMLSGVEAEPKLQKARAEDAGFYHIYRRTSQTESNHIYEEPLFLGAPNEISWLATREQGLQTGGVVATGKATFGFFVNTATRAHDALMTILALQPEGAGSPKVFRGALLRHSDTAFRPAATDIVVKKVEQTTELEALNLEVQARNSVEVDGVARAIREGDTDFAHYTHFFDEISRFRERLHKEKSNPRVLNHIKMVDEEYWRGIVEESQRTSDEAVSWPLLPKSDE